MSSTAEVCRELQEQEWQALQSIYPEFIPSRHPASGDPFVLHIDVQLSEPIPVETKEEDGSDISHAMNMTHLPPLHMNLEISPSYPREQPPVIHSLHSSHDWLSAPLIKLLKSRLLEMWDEDCILGIWVEHIRNGEDLLSSLGLLHSNPKAIRLLNPSPHTLLSALAAHEASVLESLFRSSTHTCPICLNRLLGTDCISLSPCAHVACRSCLGKFWGSCISEGDVPRVGCPDPECVKELRQASIDDVKAVVSPDEVARWQRLLRKQEIERDPTIIHCPLTFCQRPIRRSPSAQDSSSAKWDSLRICECGFSFCTYCRRAWHGPHTSCALLTTEEFVRLYLQYPEGSPDRLATEQRHGKTNVLRLVAKFQEEQLNRSWMEKETMTCPGCHIHVQKNAGCNHMTCSKCRQHFCYRCGARLEPSNPYRHFNTPGHPCYSKLFDVQSHDEDHWIAMEGLDL